MTFNSIHTLLYSKTSSDALPLSSFKVTIAPCLDPTRSADFISKYVTDDDGLITVETTQRDKLGEFYPLDLDRFDFIHAERGTII